ncbi:MAG: DUF1460 domain-containing protein [Saprospiraceae bacterium]|nr:DUF1460 domain-containing protein [Saprospiraceae bacterium]
MRQPIPSTTAQGVMRYGKSFLGYAYPKPTTDTGQQSGNTPLLRPIEEEALDVNLKKFDCVTFVENMVALTQTRRAGSPTFDNFKKNLTNIRYRKSVIDYAARLHYFSDWLFENEKQGLLRNITKEIGGQTFSKAVFYMSYKKDTLYGNMADSATFVAVQAVEKEITKRQKFYIPKDKIPDIESKIRDGDIIAVTNRLEGMDIAHTGFALRKNGRVYMIHASSQHHKVVVTNVPLADYVMKNKAQTGIMVGRLN